MQVLHQLQLEFQEQQTRANPAAAAAALGGSKRKRAPATLASPAAADEPDGMTGPDAGAADGEGTAALECLPFSSVLRRCAATAGRRPVTRSKAAANVTAGAAGSKSKAAVAAAAAAAAGDGGFEGVGADDSLAAAASRLDASRCFFEMLVLQNRGYVELRQEGPYQELLLWPMGKAIGSRV